MAYSLPPGLSPAEVAFFCEMEMVTVVPRQRLEPLNLLGGKTPVLQPPHRANLPLWLAVLLKRQRRVNIVPPPWLEARNLSDILDWENSDPEMFSQVPEPRYLPGIENSSPPFLRSSTHDAQGNALPYYWMEIGELLLDVASDDIGDPDSVRRFMKDLREVRMAKMRAGIALLGGTGAVGLRGVGSVEVGEARTFITGVIDGLRTIGASREQAKQERGDESDDGMGATQDYGDEMDL